MKAVTYHYVKMRTIVVPDNCPTDSFSDMQFWLQKQDIHSVENILKTEVRDTEIVDVEPYEDESIGELK